MGCASKERGLTGRVGPLFWWAAGGGAYDTFVSLRGMKWGPSFVAFNGPGVLPATPLPHFPNTMRTPFLNLLKRTGPWLAVGLLPLAAHAQTPITITAAQYPATAATVEQYSTASVVGAATPALGPNQSWDYRTLPTSAAVQQVTYAAIAGTPPFAGAVRQYNFTGPFGIAVTGFQGFDAQGFGQLGSVLQAQSFSLTAATGGANDVLAVPAQTVPVNTLALPLPLAVGTRVVRSTRPVTLTNLTIAAQGLSQAPFRYVQRSTSMDSVAGWGTLRLPVAGAGAGSAPMPVLLVRRRLIAIDSFYLGSQPAPPALLSALGFSQGRSSYTFSQRFFRANSAQPALSFFYANSTYSTVTGGSYSAERLPLATRDAALAAAVGLSPNPAHDAFALTVPAGPLNAATATLRNALGQVVFTRPLGLPAAGGTASFDVRGLAPGVYTLQLLTGETLVVKRVVLE